MAGGRRGRGGEARLTWEGRTRHVDATWMPRGCRMVALGDGRVRLGVGDAHVATDGTSLGASCGGARLVRWNLDETKGTRLQVADVHLPSRSRNTNQEDLELEWTPLAEDLLDGSGLVVRHVAWHPHSENHLGLLTSDNVFRLYNVARDTAQPEQEFRVDVPEGRDYHDLADTQMETFTFGTGCGWDRLTVYFSSCCGNLYYLCPVAPFGAMIPRKELSGLHAASELRPGSTVDATATWLDRALGTQALHGGVENGSGFATVRPHCLEWSSPCLVGPFPEDSLPPMARNGPSSQAACGLLHFPLYSTGGRVMVGVRAQGDKVHLFVYLLYGSIVPAWLEDTPHFGRDARGRIDWVSSSAGFHRPDCHPTVAFLLDRVDFEGSQGSGIQAVRDGSRECGLYLVLGSRAYGVDVGYAKSIVHMLERSALSKLSGDGMPTRLGKPSLEELSGLHLEGTSRVVGAVACGGVLEEGHLLVWTSGGNASRLQRRSGKGAERAQEGNASAATLGSRASTELAAFEEESWHELDALYKDLIATPDAVDLPPAPACSEDSIEGQKYMHACAVRLKERYFGYIHKAHDDLLRRSEHLREEVSQQESFQQNVEGKLANARVIMDKLRSRASQAESLAENLQARLKLLFELEHAATPPLSVAERDVVRELEELSGNLPALEAKLTPLKDRTKKLEHMDQKGGSNLPVMTSAQLKQLYASISQDSGRVQLCIEKVRRLQRQLEGMETSP